MKNILLIAYLFPPTGGVGVIRFTKFSKYLAKFGWQPHILTVKKGFYPIEDKSLLEELPAEVKITRVNYFEPAFWSKKRYWQSFLAYFLYPKILFPDRQILWFWPAFWRALKIIKEEKIEIIFTTSSPITNHLIGWALKKFTKVKWVADFRDEWTINPLFYFPNPFFRWGAKIWEKKIVNEADQVTSALPKLIEHFYTLCPEKEKFTAITNGFDPDDFSEKLLIRKKKYCQIIYSGSLYPVNRADIFWAAFKELNLKNIKVDFIGQKKWVSHQESIRSIRKADILLLILTPHQRPAHIPAKFFEYLAARRPILALVPETTHVAALIKKMGVGEIVDPCDQEGIKNKILNLYHKWQKNSLKNHKVNIDQFNRKKLTEKLVKIFDKIIRKRQKTKLCLIGNLQSPQNINLVNFLKKKKNYEVHFITCKKNLISGIKTYFVNHQESSNIIWAVFNHFSTLIKIKIIVSRIKPDIIHGQGINFFGIWASFTNVRPLIVTAWGSDVMGYEKFIGPERFLIRRALKKADLIMGTSLAVKEKIKKILGSNPPFSLVHFGIDLDVFKKKSASKLRKGLNLKNEKIIFSPRDYKVVYNINIIIEAFSRLVKQKPNCRLVLISREGPDMQKIKNQIKRLKLEPKVIFLPKVPNQDMADYYNLADVVVSIPSSDGCSVSFLEAMACEKKIVVSDLPYIQEWVFDNVQTKGQNLWVVPVKDAPTTAQAIQEALDLFEKKFISVGRKNRQLVAQEAEINDNFQKLEQLYQGLI